MNRKEHTVERIVAAAGKRAFRDLLLLADPSDAMVARYIDGSDMFVWRTGCGETVGEAVVDRRGEIKNLAVAPAFQRQGWGRRILDDLCARYAGKFPVLTVGTSDGGVPFYERCGFRYSHTVRNFFTDNYPEPVIDEDGSRCRDMIYLTRTTR